jgi:hypothetical protein
MQAEPSPTNDTAYTSCPIGGPSYEGVRIDYPAQPANPKGVLVLKVGEIRRVGAQVSAPDGPTPQCGLWTPESLFRAVSWRWAGLYSKAETPPFDARFVGCTACEVVLQGRDISGDMLGLARNAAAGTYVFDLVGQRPGDDSFSVFASIGFCEAQGAAPATACGAGSWDTLRVQVVE